MEPAAAPTANKQLHIRGSIDPSYYTTSGAWNGSGVAYIWQNLTGIGAGLLASSEYSYVVYYQHDTGEIPWMRQSPDSTWEESTRDLAIVAADATNSTPISAVQYTSNGVNYLECVLYVCALLACG